MASLSVNHEQCPQRQHPHGGESERIILLIQSVLKEYREIYESEDRGGGQAAEPDVTALPPHHISTVYSLHIPP